MDTISIKSQFKWLARMGYASRGVIYLVIGTLAVMAAFGLGGGETTDTRGALKAILEEPYGELMLVALIVGLFGYSAWRVTQSVKDLDDHGTSVKGLGIRFGLFASAVTHGALAVFAISLLMGGGGEPQSGPSGANEAGWINGSMGQLALGALAAGFIIAGLAHIYKGWTAGFERYMSIPSRYNTWARPLCRFGLVARGVVWCIVGWFLIDSALQARTGDIHGLGDALDSLAGSGHGAWLMAVAAAGLAAFGVYSILEAIFRRINPSGSGVHGTGVRSGVQ